MGKAKRERDIKIGDIYMIYFNGYGNEQKGWRPGLIIQNNVGNKYSPNVIAVPLTSSLKKISQPTHVLISSKDTPLIKDSLVLCENPERISKSRLGNYITTTPDKYMNSIAEAVLLASSIISFLSPDRIENIRNKAVCLNQTS